MHGTTNINLLINLCGFAGCLLASSQHNLYDICLSLGVQCWTPDDGQVDCSKHVELHSENKFGKLVDLVQ